MSWQGRGEDPNILREKHLVISPHFSCSHMGKFSLSKLNVFKVEEDRPTPREVYNWRIWMTALLASTGSMLIGYDSGFIGGTTQTSSFKKNFKLDQLDDQGSEIISNVISCFHLAAFGGALFIYPISHRWGYRIAMLIASAIGVAGSAVMIGGASGSLAPFYVGRVLTGLTVGASTNVTVVYLSEVSPAPIRGQIVALFEMGWRVGDLVGFWINVGVKRHVGESHQWLIPVAIQLIPASLFFIGSFVLRESPRWLCQNDRDAEALQNLCWLRQLDVNDEYMGWEYGTMKSSIDFQNRTVGNRLLDPAKEVFIRNTKYFKRLGITFGLFLFQNFMGIQTMNYYSVTIFKQLGQEGEDAQLNSSGYFAVVKFFCTLIFVFVIVDNFGRRIAFMTSSTFCSIFFWYIGAYLKVADLSNPGPGDKAGDKAAIGLMYCWTAAFILAWSGGPFVWAAEVYDQSIRNFTQALNAAVSWLPIYTMTKCTNMMISAMDYGVFFFFASIALLSIPFVFFLVPETKGIPLEAIDRLFSSKVPAFRAHKLVTSALQVEESNANGNGEKDGIKGDVEHIEVLDKEDEELDDRVSGFGFDR